MPRELTNADREEFRDRLCTAAETLFAEYGAHNVSIRQIAQAMQVSAMTPYRYFHDKDEILAAVRSRGFEHFANVVEKARQETAGDAYSKALAVRAAYLDFAFENEHRYKLMFDFDQADESEYPDLVAAVIRARRSMTAYVEDLIAADLLNGDAQQLGELIWSASHGAVVLEMARKLPKGSARALAAQLGQLILK